MRKSKRFRSKAFTLIELLIAIAVAALVISGVFMSLINSMVLDSYNQNFTVAMNIARAKLENVFNQRNGFANISSSSGILTANVNHLDGAWRIDVTDVQGAGDDSELKNIKVAICWKDRRGRIIGDCRDSDGDGVLEWIPGQSDSPCSVETSIAKR